MLRLKANPTFKAPVKIPLPGGETVEITIEFKHMTKDEYSAFIEKEKGAKRSDEDAIIDVAVGWEGVDGEFNTKNIHEFCQQYHGAASRIARTFVEELTQYKLGN
jgi:hypothetical protein